MTFSKRRKRPSFVLEAVTSLRLAAEFSLGLTALVVVAVQGAPGAPGATAATGHAEVVETARAAPQISARALDVSFRITPEDAPASLDFEAGAENAATTSAPEIEAPDDAILTMLAEAYQGRLTETARVRRGATVASLLSDAGVGPEERAAAARALNDVFNPRELRAGQDVTLYLARAEDSNDAHLIGLEFAPSEERRVQVSRRADGGYGARAFETPLTMRLSRIEGEITQSLYADATQAGAHPSTIAEIANLMAFAVDFQREIHPGDRFEILAEEWVGPDGRVLRAGDIQFVSFTPSGRELEYWRFVNEHDEVEFFDADGESARRFLMRTPINGARLSSGFGRRRHPISGYSRMHRGTDFAAPSGTRIYAAGDGVVERANRYGGYGNYVRIRHANGYQTAYAHMSRFARGMRAGRRVRQGEVIGYVGSTGASTGPHLHYEVLRSGSHVNPMRLDLPTGRTLEDGEREAFEAERARINALRAELGAVIEASAEESAVASATNADAGEGPAG